MSKDETSQIEYLKAMLARQKAEIFQLKHIIDNLPGDIYWKNKEGVYIGMNVTGRESLRTMGFSWKLNDIVGKTDYDLFEKKTADEFRKNDLEVMQGGVVSTREETATLPSGEKIVQLSTKRPLWSEDGHVEGIIGNTIDITYLKKIEDDLRSAKDKAEESSRVKMEFIKNMEHDIRTPFTGAWGIASSLWEMETDPEKKELLDGIVRCTKELLDFCNTILDFSRVETTSMPMLARKFDIRALVIKIINAETPPAKYKNLILTNNCASNLPNLLIGDEYRLYRILLNLVSNAVKFTNEGHVALKVELARQEENRVILKFIVEDTGIGIPKEKQDFIYEAFTRGVPSNQGKYMGLGVGHLLFFLDK